MPDYEAIIARLCKRFEDFIDGEISYQQAEDAIAEAKEAIKDKWVKAFRSAGGK